MNLKGSSMFNPMDLSGKRVLITGSSSGIGRATAIYLSRLGAHLVLAGRNQVRLEETFNALQGGGHKISAFDLTQIDAIPLWLKELAKSGGTFSGVVHSAGIQVTMPIRSMTRNSFDEIMNVNVGSAFGLAKGFRQKNVNADGGSIVFLSSIMGVVGQPAVSAYCASKGALVSFGKSLALELAREGIRVNCVLPGHVRTEMAEKLEQTLTGIQFEAIKAAHPLGLGTPDDVAAAVAFLLADTSRWITGSSLIVDGGYTAH